MEVNWDRLDPRLQCVDGLDDIMRFDLQHFCRRMQPPEEPHYRSAQQSSMSQLVLDCVVSCRVMSCHVKQETYRLQVSSCMYFCAFSQCMPALGIYNKYLWHCISVKLHMFHHGNRFKFGCHQIQVTRQHEYAI